MGFDKLSPNGVNISPLQINKLAKIDEFSGGKVCVMGENRECICALFHG